MAKKKQETQNPADIGREIEELDREIAELQRQKEADERAALAEPLRDGQEEVVKTFPPFAEAVQKLRSLWCEIQEILTEGAELREEIKEARDLARDFPELSHADLRSVQVPDRLTTLFPEERFLWNSGVLSGNKDQARICGRHYTFSRIRRREINGLTSREQRELLA